MQSYIKPWSSVTQCPHLNVRANCKVVMAWETSVVVCGGGEIAGLRELSEMTWWCTMAIGSYSTDASRDLESVMTTTSEAAGEQSTLLPSQPDPQSMGDQDRNTSRRPEWKDWGQELCQFGISKLRIESEQQLYLHVQLKDSVYTPAEKRQCTVTAILARVCLVNFSCLTKLNPLQLALLLKL